MTTIARCTRIDLDGEEMPIVLHLDLSEDVVDRVRRDFDLTDVILLDDGPGYRLPVAEAADMARHFGRIAGLDEPGVAFYRCIDNVIVKFWHDGMSEAPTAGLVPNSAKADHLPCGHPLADSLFTLQGGSRELLTHPPFRSRAVPIDVPAIAWCTKGCGWVSLDDAAYERLKAVRA